MGTLSGKTALVTGSGRGIGKAIAERFGKLGANVIVNYSASKPAALVTVEAIEKNGAAAVAIQADLARVNEIYRLFEQSIEHFGRLDIVVANAGIELVGQAVVDFTEEEFDRLFNVNTKGAFFTLQAAAKHVANNGRIIFVGSSNTKFPRPGYGLYGGSKLAPQFLVEVLAKEIGVRGVTVNSILPTATEGAGVSTKEVRPQVREFIRNNNPMQRMATLEDVANAAEYLASDLSAYVSGQHLLLSGGAPA
jgi:3-oxoacyl-[acyl-carrier protein] reductase